MTLHGPDIRPEPPRRLTEMLADLSAAFETEGQPGATLLTGTVFEDLASRFGLDAPETSAIAMLAAAAIDQRSAAALSASGHAPTVADLMTAIPGLRWESLSQSAVLRGWFLIRLGSAQQLRNSTVAIDSRILDWCQGDNTPDARLGPHLRPLAARDILSDRQCRRADTAADTLAERITRAGTGSLVIVGEGQGTRDALASRVAASLSMEPLGIDASLFDTPAADSRALQRLLARETVLARALPLITVETLGPREAAFCRSLEMPALILADSIAHRTLLPRGAELFTLEPPDAAERSELWHRHLELPAHAALSDLAESFVIGADDIARIAADLEPLPPDARADAAWATARQHLAPPPEPLVQEIRPTVGWADLILPPATEATLRLIASQIRHRARVYRDWHFADRLSRGLGVTALFSGPSGTGKTLAAEVIAAELDLPLLRVNLSQVVDKYIGETEKHLDHVFAMAERAGAILFFDEAEALFHKRGDGESAQERFAAMTVAYLLQRLECCNATCILATNMRASVDDAFLRRIRFAVHFAFPAAAERARLWAAAFPGEAPLDRVDPVTLALLPATGGTIRNAALNAAFLAAETESAIGMTHVCAALEIENAKLAQPIDLGPLRRRASL
ncbi:ATP-binding protein [Marimonas sp. MJW-29]|uniref:ATP-binding protein n=1 Tax=Sulfitobacter sediminis TaxID=3234186 RepID=A0ABV3RMJ7_9RHOB